MHIHTDYKDLGEIINATNMAAGATVYSNWFDGVEWVRNVVMFSTSDQQPYDLSVCRRNISGNAPNYLGTVSSITTTAIKETILYANATLINSGILGTSVRWAIKNNSASPNTYAKLYIQLMGL